MKNKILIINDIIIMIMSIFLSILGAKFINKSNSDLSSLQLNENYFLQAHPIGSIYITTNSNENTPEKMKELYGGTWEFYGDGRILQSSSSMEAGTTGGNNEITLQIENIPAHSHNIPALSVSSVTEALGGKWVQDIVTPNALGPRELFLINVVTNYDYFNQFSDGTLTISGQTTTPSITDNVGSGTPFNVQNDYITVYMWKRIE